MHERYNGADQIRAANGAGMNITHVGKSVIPSPSRPLHLNHVLHVPRAHKQLIYVHRFNIDNHTFMSCIHIFSWLRTRSRRGSCSEDHVWVVSTLYHNDFLPSLISFSRLSFVRLRIGGIARLATRLGTSSLVSSRIISCFVLVSSLVSRFVIPVFEPRPIS
jgi:hypothetical protein